MSLPPSLEWVVAAAAGLVGLAVGSFLNVCIWRLPRGLSVLAPRSYCPSCERPLAWWEMVPVVSYVALGGRCRTCRSRISSVYPLVESATAALWAGSVLAWGLSLQALGAVVFGSLLIAGGVIDIYHQRLPDVITLPGIALGFVFAPFNPWVGFGGAVAGAMVGGGFLLAVAVVSRGGMGGGDIKLGAMMGAFLGWRGTLVALLLGFVAGALVGGPALMIGRKGRRDLIAFGPFLAAGSLAALFWGERIVDWYVRLVWR